MSALLPQTVLSRPLRIGSQVFANRFFIEPMQCNDANPDGTPSELTRARYHKLFAGGAAVVEVEAVALHPDWRSSKNQLVLDVDDDKNCDAWASFIHELRTAYPDQGLLVQLHHSGELCGAGFARPVTPKPLWGLAAKQIDADYVDQVIERFVRTSKFLCAAGVTGVDLKIAHGYFWSAILRPYNDRAWKYGGSFAARASAAYAMCDGVRAAVDSKFLVGAKLSVWDERPGGQGHPSATSPLVDGVETVKLAQGLERRGANFFIESLGDGSCSWGLLCPNTYEAHTAFLHMDAAGMLKAALQPTTAVICSGLSLLRDGNNNGIGGVDPEKNSLAYWAATSIEEDIFDMAGLGRQSLADPALPHKLLSADCKTNAEAAHSTADERPQWCLACNRCCDLEVASVPVGCAVYNPLYRAAYKTLGA